MKYQVNITAIEHYAVIVEAKDKQQAKKTAKRVYESGFFQAGGGNTEYEFEVEERSGEE